MFHINLRFRSCRGSRWYQTMVCCRHSILQAMRVVPLLRARSAISDASHRAKVQWYEMFHPCLLNVINELVHVPSGLQAHLRPISGPLRSEARCRPCKVLSLKKPIIRRINPIETPFKKNHTQSMPDRMCHGNPLLTICDILVYRTWNECLIRMCTRTQRKLDKHSLAETLSILLAPGAQLIGSKNPESE